MSTLLSERTRVQSVQKGALSHGERWNEVHDDRFLAGGDIVWLFVIHNHVFLCTTERVISCFIQFSDVIVT